MRRLQLYVLNVGGLFSEFVLYRNYISTTCHFPYPSVGRRDIKLRNGHVSTVKVFNYLGSMFSGRRPRDWSEQQSEGSLG